METEQARHKKEESLIKTQFGTSHNISNKLQNGGPSSEEDSLQNTGDSNWNHFKSSTGANLMKRHRDDCNSPALVQGLFDQGSYAMNGELKHALTEQSLLVHQPKKFKTESEIKRKENISSTLVGIFPELTKATELECKAPQTEITLDKRTGNFPNGDIFCLPRNKQASVPNGVVSPPSTIESTPGDLLEKTLSQYYPEQVSIAPQTLTGSQLDAVKGSRVIKLPNEGAQHTSLMSGLPNSLQMPESQQQQPGASSNEGDNNYNSVNYVVNGYSKHFGADHQQQQQQHQQQQPSYSDQDLSLCQMPHIIPPTNTANSSKLNQNGLLCYSDYSNPQGIYAKANQEFNQNSFLECNAPLKTTETGGYGPSPNCRIQEMGRSEEPGSAQPPHRLTDRGYQYVIPHTNFKQNAGSLHEAESAGTTLQQPAHAEFGKVQENVPQQSAGLSRSNPHQKNWAELNTSHSTQQTANGSPSQVQEHDVWKGCPAKPQSEQQAANPNGQMLEPNSAQRFQTQGVFTSSSHGPNSFQQQQQDCLQAQTHHVPAQHNTAPEWPQSNSKAPQMHKALTQKMSEQCNFSQNQQTDSHYQTHMQSEHLSEDPDIQDILTTGFLTHQQQQQQQHCHLPRPLSHPQQFEGQELKSPIYRPHSQPQPGHQQLHPSQPLRIHSTQSNKQHIPSEHSMFSYSNTTEMQHLQQNQRQYPQNSGSSNLKQFPPQRPNHCHQPNHVDFRQTSTQSQPLLLQGALNQQVTTQMHPKPEQQLKTSCTQFQMGSQLPQEPVGPHGDVQRHAALRMHLLKRQECQGLPHLPQTTDLKHGLKAVKTESETRFDLPCSQHQEQQFQMRETGFNGVHIKQENHQSLCEQSKRQASILASMEQSLKQYHLSPVFEKKSVVLNSANKVKVESSGPVTILSTNTDLSRVESAAVASATVALKKPPDSTPRKEHLLQNFMDSPMKLLDTPIKNLLDTPMKTQYDIASCHCVEQICEKDEGPYYTHLGSAPSVAGIREKMEKRSGLTGRSIRIEKVVYTGKEGKSTQGCPIAKWVIRRSSVEEKLLVLVRERNGHTCETACIVVVILMWEGILPSLADRLYLELSETLTKHGAHTQRRCALNEERTCACQGLNSDTCGASFSFGCSWSMYYNGCKFARSKVPRKFKLLGDDVKEEERIEHNFQNLATVLAPLYKTLAPEAYGNQVEHEHRATDCRLGVKEGRPFSGVTACLDFCAHAHRDLHNMQGGSTVVCTLTREDNREIGKIPEDEQLHVLPLYKPSNTDEFGSEDGQQEKIKSGAIQVLSAFRRQVRMLAEPAKSCRQKKLDAKKAAANKNAMLDTSNDKAEKALLAKSKAGTYENISQSAPMAGTIPGAVGANLQPGQPAHLQQVQQQQQRSILPPFPFSTNAASYPRFSSHPGTFQSTSRTSSMYPPQATPPAPASPYSSPFHATNSYINGSNRPHPGYQCNGGMPLDNYHPLYFSNPKHLDMYQQQRPVLYSEQQYGVHQRYEANYPPRHGEPGLHVNGYNVSSVRPVHPMRPYAPYISNRGRESQYMDSLSRAPSAHGGLDYTATVSKGNQFGGYANPYLSQGAHILTQGQDPLHMQIKTEMGITVPQLGDGCLNPEKQSGLGLSNGNHIGSVIKQEPGTPQTPITQQKPEMWSDNEHNFLDPDIGGVAVAPSHGSVLIECAKRELHATTPIKNPDRNHPTRISLVFYQHKNMNEAKHGLALWEAKMAEKAREKEEDAERNGGEGTPSKGSKKGVKREHPESSETTMERPYKRFIQALMEGSLSCTTNTYVSTSPFAFTKVTGPYSQFV